MPKYSKKAQDTVESAMHRMKEGKLKSSSGDKVTNPKQAIAIGLSEAREKGAKVPPAPEESKAKSRRSTRASASTEKSTRSRRSTKASASSGRKTTTSAISRRRTARTSKSKE